MSNQGFRPRKLHGTLSSKIRKFQELYEEIIQEIEPKSNSSELRSLSPNTFTRLVHENFTDVIPELMEYKGEKEYYLKIREKLHYKIEIHPKLYIRPLKSRIPNRCPK